MAPEGGQQLEAAVALLELENAFLLNYLQRVAHGSLEEGGAGAADSEAAAAAAADAALPREPLLLAEKQELCAVQAVTTRREAEAVQAQGELERSVAAAAAADAQGYQTAEVARDLAALLDLLGLPEPTSEAAAVYQQATSAADQAASAAQPAESAAAGTAAAELRLPTAKQLSKADLNGPRLQEFLEGLLARHGAAAARLQQRTAMLKGRLAKAEAALAARSELGDSLKRVDWEALRIEHAQAGAALSAADGEAITLKAQLAAAAQRLADQRAALDAAAGAVDSLRRQAAVREGQLARVRADAAKANAERIRLEAECQRLKGQRGGVAGGATAAGGSTAGSPEASPASRGGGGATILDYMKIKKACAEAAKRVADWQRKLEVQAGQRGAAAGRC